MWNVYGDELVGAQQFEPTAMSFQNLGYRVILHADLPCSSTGSPLCSPVSSLSPPALAITNWCSSRPRPSWARPALAQSAPCDLRGRHGARHLEIRDRGQPRVLGVRAEDQEVRISWGPSTPIRMVLASGIPSPLG